MEFADLQYANLWRAKLQNANLWYANLQEAHLWEPIYKMLIYGKPIYMDADLRNVDLTDAKNLEVEQLLKAKTLYEGKTT